MTSKRIYNFTRNGWPADMTSRRFCSSLLLLMMSMSFHVYGQMIGSVQLFPEKRFIPTFSADQYAHQMMIENIVLTKNIRGALGGVIPIFAFDVLGTKTQASLGSSVHFEVQPKGQAHVVSTDFYVDYLLLDFLLHEKYFLRLVTGHTSHHLSDNWFERLHLTTAVHYSRDYVQCMFVYFDAQSVLAFAGVDYGYIFHLEGKEAKRFKFHLGGEKYIATLVEKITAYVAFDVKLHQEAGFTSSQAFQCGVKLPMQYGRILKVAYQFRGGLDERGQFFPQHISLHTIGLYIDV